MFNPLFHGEGGNWAPHSVLDCSLMLLCICLEFWRWFYTIVIYTFHQTSGQHCGKFCRLRSCWCLHIFFVLLLVSMESHFGQKLRFIFMMTGRDLMKGQDFHHGRSRFYHERSRFSWWQVEILLWTVEIFMMIGQNFIMNGGDFHNGWSRFHLFIPGITHGIASWDTGSVQDSIFFNVWC